MREELDRLLTNLILPALGPGGGLKPTKDAEALRLAEILPALGPGGGLKRGSLDAIRDGLLDPPGPWAGRRIETRLQSARECNQPGSSRPLGPGGGLKPWKSSNWFS